jgi:hypothetical protein
MFEKNILKFLLASVGHRFRQPRVLSSVQGCQMVHFQTKNRNLGKFWRVLQRKMLVYVLNSLSILRPFDIYFMTILVYIVLIWYIYPMMVYCTNKNLATLIWARQIRPKPQFARIVAPCRSMMLSIKMRATTSFPPSTVTVRP